MYQAQSTQQKQVTQQYATYFLAHCLKELYPESEDPLFGNSNASKIFKDFLIDAYAQKMEKKVDFGIGKKIEKSLIQLQDIKALDVR